MSKIFSHLINPSSHFFNHIIFNPPRSLQIIQLELNIIISTVALSSLSFFQLVLLHQQVQLLIKSVNGMLIVFYFLFETDLFAFFSLQIIHQFIYLVLQLSVGIFVLVSCSIQFILIKFVSFLNLVVCFLE